MVKRQLAIASCIWALGLRLADCTNFAWPIVGFWHDADMDRGRSGDAIVVTTDMADISEDLLTSAVSGTLGLRIIKNRIVSEVAITARIRGS